MTTPSDDCLAEINNLNVVFESLNLPREEMLLNVSFSLRKGKIHLLIGGNGTGKTSLLKTLIGLLPENRMSDDRVIQLPNGTPIRGADFPRYIKIGYIPQHPHEALIPAFNVSENISFRTFLRNNDGFSDWLITQRYNHKLESRISEIVNSFDVTKRLLSERLHSGIEHLSGGEQQILNLAAMVFDRCDLLIMDEPTSKLDTKNKGMFWEFIAEIRKSNNTTMLIVTHDSVGAQAERLADFVFQIVNKAIIKS